MSCNDLDPDGVRVAVHRFGRRVRLFFYINDRVILPLAQPGGKVGIAYVGTSNDRRAVLVPRRPRVSLPLKQVRVQRMRPRDTYCAIVTIRLPPGAANAPMPATPAEWQRTDEGLVIHLPAGMFGGAPAALGIV